MIGTPGDKCQRVLCKIERLIKDGSNHNKRTKMINKRFTTKSPEKDFGDFQHSISNFDEDHKVRF